MTKSTATPKRRTHAMAGGAVFSITFFLFLAACGGGGGSGGGGSPAGTTNHPPMARVSDDRRIILGTGPVTLDASGSSDADGDSLQFAWSFVQRPNGSAAVLSSTEGATTTFTPDLVGTYRIELTVSDDRANSTDVVDIDVASNTNATANAGADQEANRNETITLDGSASSDPDGQPLTYTWTQLQNSCPDVTGGTGALTGVRPSFQTLDVVCTLVFDLRVSDGLGDSFADSVLVFVLEEKGNALFVDGAAGNDIHPGSRTQPFKTLGRALASAGASGADIYLTAGVYGAVAMQLEDRVSLYGGYTSGWERLSNLETVLTCDQRGIQGLSVSGFTVDGLRIQCSGPFFSALSAFGLRLVDVRDVRIANNVIATASATSGGAGASGANGLPGSSGGNGGPGSCDGAQPGSGGQAGVGGFSGGVGGRGGAQGPNPGSPGLNGSGSGGGAGGLGGAAGRSDLPLCPANPGLAGAHGAAGADGAAGANGLPGASMIIVPSSLPLIKGGDGGPGSAAESGSGGGGGGGGGGQGGSCVGDGSGNGGGGGGGGGHGGAGGHGGSGGHAAVGIYLQGVDNVEIENNVIETGQGGRGGAGGVGGSGSLGGAGGLGGGVCTQEVGAGGNGGSGGKGGQGGQGGGGSGGPTIGIASVSSINVRIGINAMTLGTPGAGGLPNGVPGVSQQIFQQ